MASGDPRSDDSTETELRPPDDATLTSAATGGSPAEPVTLIREGGAGPLPDLGLTTVPRDHYLVEGEIARGGMGRVLAARDRRLGRPVALKELLSSSPELARRFEREALMTAGLQHPSIVNVHEAGRWPSGEPFYAMKHVVGRPLDKVVLEAGSLAGRLALLPEVLAVAEALAYAHEQGVIHRDLKPANVLVGTFGETVVVDWGLAKDLLREEAFDEAKDEASVEPAPDGLTVAGTVLGTPAYMAPEQARGVPVDERADVYALGAILYTVLAGVPPYAGPSSTAVLQDVLKGPPPPLQVRQAGLPEDLLALVRKAMAPEKEDRYRTAQEFAEDLRRFQTGQLVGAHRYSTGQLLRRWIARHRAPVGVATAAALILVVGGAVAFQRVRAERDAAQARSDELVLAHARSAVETDPTEAIAWLKQYSLGAPHWSAARMIAAEARSRGFAETTLRGHEHSVNWIAFSPDGRLLASSSGDQSVRLWDLATRTSRTLGTFDWFGYALVFSPDGRYVAAASALDLRLWDLATGQSRDFPGRFPGIKFHDKDIAFSPDGRTLASVGVAEGLHGVSDGRVVLRLIDVGTGRIRLIYGKGGLKSLGKPGDLSALNSFGEFRLAFSADGRRLAARIEKDRVRVWDLVDESGRDLPARRGLAFGPAGSLLALGSNDNLVRLIDLDSGRERLLKGHTAPVLDVAFSRDGLLASAGEDGQVRLWDTKTGEGRGAQKHQGAVLRIRFSPDGRWVASTGEERTVDLWEVGSGVTRTLRGHRAVVLSIAFAPDGLRLATSSGDRSIRIWRVNPEDVRPVGGPDPDWARKKAFSPDGRLLAVANRGGTIRLLSLSGAKERRLEGNRGEVVDLAFSPEGAMLASASLDDTVRLWAIATGESRVAHTHARGASSMAFSPDGRRLASGGGDRLVALKDVAADDAPRLFPGHTFTVSQVAFSPDGRWLGSAAGVARHDSGLEDPVFWLWSTATGQARALAGHEDTVCRVAFSSDGMLAATASMDKTIGLWDLATGNRRVLAGHGSIVFDVAFSPDSRTLASGGEDSTLRLWDVATSTSRTLYGHRAGVWQVRFSPDGATVATNSWDGMARLWDVATGQSRSLEDASHATVFSPTGPELATTGEDGQIWIWRDDLPRDPAALRAWLLGHTDSTVTADSSR